MNVALWIIQGLLAALFLFAGAVKLILPMDEIAQQIHLSVLFLRFIGLCETLGAAGLILPGLLHVRPGLTPLAATGLVIIMIGATTLTVINGPLVAVLLPIVTGLLAAFVAYARWRSSLTFAAEADFSDFFRSGAG